MHPELDQEACTGCGVCIEVCPSEVYQLIGERPEPVDPEECIECGACEEQCPAKAIVLVDD
jgi:NAD-dependent dihydropyrimidine dehydrogenase PreA subunit